VDLAPERIARILSGRKFTVFFSGGKDSLAALLWVLDNVRDLSGMRVVYAEVTGNTHPECNRYVHDVAAALGLEGRLVHVRREDRDFWDYMLRVGPPFPWPARWCLNEMKRKAWGPFVHGTFAVLGIRAGESRARALYRDLHKTSDGQFTIMPVFSWSREKVLDFIREHGLRLNPCYARYGHSGNCMFCPLYSRSQIIRTLSDPEWREIIVATLKAAPVRGPLQAMVRDRWLRLAGQATLPEVAAA